MADSDQAPFDRLCNFARQTAVIDSVQALLGWDERTMMPPANAEHRAEQMSLLSGMIHARWTAPELGEMLEDLSTGSLAADRHSDTGATIRGIKREHERRIKLPMSLVEELARTAVLGQQAWQKARSDNDFLSFRPWLEKTVTLKRQEADLLGYNESPYDALLDEYEPDERTSNVTRVLSELRCELVPLVDAIRGSSRRPDVSILKRPFPVNDQESFGREAALRIGFDFDRGRMDRTAHPFCSTAGPCDCRITTRFSKDAFGDAFFSILHEAGHGIYEQGLRTDQFGLPLGTYASLGIHESQSRMWENLVGRCHAYWKFLYPEAQRRFPAALADVGLDDFYSAINDVRPSLIRVEADEATYNLHILVRFELEQALLSGDLSISDLPGVWSEKYRQHLGIEPPNDADGVLQDIHWAGGAVGYFPTYSLGNLYAAQFFAQADTDLGGLESFFARGEFRPLREWLRVKIHGEGQRYSASELVQRVTGQPLSHEPLIEHLRRKLGPLYAL